jgi:hypothetical protein
MHGFTNIKDMLLLILWRILSRLGLSEDSCQHLSSWISIKPADGPRRISFKFLKLYFFLEPEIPRLIGFGLNTVDRSESGTLLNSYVSNTAVNAGAPFLFAFSWSYVYWKTDSKCFTVGNNMYGFITLISHILTRLYTVYGYTL